MRRVAVVALACVVSLTWAGPVGSEPPPAPVAADDHVVVGPFLDVEVDVLANDAGGDPVGADLQVCRIDPPAGDVDVHIWSRDGWPGDREATPASTYLDVEGSRRMPAGDLAVDYAACDRHRTAWATLTLEVRRVGAERTVDDPATARFANPFDERIVVFWVTPGSRMHLVRLKPLEEKETVVGRERVRWFAYPAASTGDDPFPRDLGWIPREGARSTPSAAAASGGGRARADDVSAPVTAPDQVTLDYYDSVDLAVLDNDSDDRPGDLAICRIDVPATDFGVTALPEPTWTHGSLDGPPFLHISASAADAGDYQITYYACDREQLTPGTLTVTVREFREPRIHRVIGRPGAVRFHNRGYRTIDVQYFEAGHYSEKHHLLVPPGEAGTLRVPYDHLFYFVDTRIGPLTHGRIRDVQQDG